MKISPKIFIKKKKSIDLANEPLSLIVTAKDGIPVLTFPPQVVDSLRRTISRLNLKKSLPAQLSMVAALRQEGVTYLSRAFAAILANDFSTSVCAVELNWWWMLSIILRAA